MDLRLPPAGEAEVEAGGRRLRLTNLDRLLWPEEGITKRDVLEYYARIADVIVPHLRGRPVTMARFPGGILARGFLQNECRGAPGWLHTATLELRTGERRRYCLIDDAPSLLWVANLGTLELHPYPSAADRPERPLAVIFDLDPGRGTTVLDACRVALRLRERLVGDGLSPVVKTSGGSGLHVFAGIEDGDFATVRRYARAVAAGLTEALPALVADPSANARRPGLVMIDWRQNDPRRSTIAPYSLRVAIPPAVSAPLHWEEVEAALGAGRRASLRVSPREVLERIRVHGDLFALS